MNKLKIKTEDKRLIKEYVKWCIKKGFFPSEYECSGLINNMNQEHRCLVEENLYYIALSLLPHISV